MTSIVPKPTRRALLTIGAALLACPARADDAPAPQIVVVFGDSQAEGLAAGLRRVVRTHPGLRIQNRTKPGTAISQPENYDWPATLRDYVPDDAVTTAVLMFGGNDRLPMHPTPGVTIAFRSPPWHDAYCTRVAAMIASLKGKKLRIIWVGDPICRSAKYSDDMAYLNGLYRDVLAGTGATFLNIWTAIADADGNFAAYGKSLDGATARLRLDDGIHFTPAGYDILATKVVAAIIAAPPHAKPPPPAAPDAETPPAAATPDETAPDAPK